jgi:high frequency lysogenization protein
MANKQSQQIMALAAVCETAWLVQQIARQGTCDEQALRVLLNSILNTDPPTAESVYPDRFLLRDGYTSLVEQLGNNRNPKNIEMTRYVIGMVALERKLSGRKRVMQAMGDRINQAKRQVLHFDILSDAVLANFASIYSDLISTLGPRIQIAGAPLYLQQPLVQNKIRALLLAGIRASVLWRQVGGRRRHILFFRKRVIASAEAALRGL